MDTPASSTSTTAGAVAAVDLAAAAQGPVGDRLAVRVAALAALAGLLGATMPAHADAPLWELGLGMAALRLPHYRGADQSRNWLLPVPYAVYRGRILRADREGARALLVDTAPLQIDLSASASAPTSSRDNEARRGMADLDPTLELGPNANLALARGQDWKLELRLPLRAVMTLRAAPRHVGWSATPAINLDVQQQGWNLGAQLSALAGDRRLHGYFYDVTLRDVTPARPAYRAPGGRAGWQATLAASRRVESLWLGAFVRADSLAGAAFASSPLVRQRQTMAFGLGLSWVFAASTQRVSEAP